MGKHDDVVTRREIGHGEFVLPPVLDERSLLTHRFFSLALRLRASLTGTSLAFLSRHCLQPRLSVFPAQLGKMLREN
jgi:hypothetical protein